MILDVKSLAQKTRKELSLEISALPNPPKLSVILVGENPASLSYVAAKEKAAAEIGIVTETIRLPESISENALIELIGEKNKDISVDGILVQFPLPPHIDKNRVIHAISVVKDVDGFTPESVETAFLGKGSGSSARGFLPCTPKGVVKIIEKFGPTITGANITIIGNGNLVGKPLSLILGNMGATVTICNRSTKDLKAHTLPADIIVAAAGVPGLIKADMVRDGALVIDVGITRVNGKLYGDCCTEEIAQKADITPVPGGVGPMTVAMLMGNTLEAATRK